MQIVCIRDLMVFLILHQITLFSGPLIAQFDRNAVDNASYLKKKPELSRVQRAFLFGDRCVAVSMITTRSGLLYVKNIGGLIKESDTFTHLKAYPSSSHVMLDGSDWRSKHITYFFLLPVFHRIGNSLYSWLHCSSHIAPNNTFFGPSYSTIR